MTISIVDTHAHLDMALFDKDRSDVISRAESSGVGAIINVGIDFDSSRKAIKLADEHPHIWATVGFHPHEASLLKKSDVTELSKMAGHPKVIAIGEIGLDFYRNLSPRESQFQALDWQLELADRLNLPVIIHSRQADEETQTALNHWLSSRTIKPEKPTGVIHCFNSNLDIACKYIDMGFYLAFGAYIGYPASQHLKHVVSSIPSDRLLLETDCPFLPPQQYRGQRNEPSYISLTLGMVADTRKTSREKLAAETTDNAYKVFNLPPS